MKLGLGTAALGRPQYINVRQETCDNSDLAEFRKHSFSVLEAAYNSGIRYFDTAPGYGLAEALVVEWLQTKDDKSIEIATKWGYTYTANFDKKAIVHEVKEHSISKLNEQWNFSKQLLPYLKVYQIHSATLETGVLENKQVLEQLAFLKKEHNLKIGLTTTGTNQIEVIKKALTVLVDGEQIFDLFQVTYNFLDQSLLAISKELTSQNKSIVIKEALANGRIFKNKNYPHYNKMHTIVENLAKKHKVGVDAISLKYCEQTIPESIVLSGASNVKQLEENLKMNSFSLSSDEIELLNSFKVAPEFYWSERKKLQWN
ncbi:aldo/keto reductase [Polaribacter glomeratus]|uniref:Oxidoreductase n=1 Tax=Polaribacter glomeratus TaxID=102 RepID=A0A2S7WGC7_9FLAO|nr:aldo/keto reductase [Polaribacter glomeratus]PQJ76312.1 oxidoreductase [Polaribacter glomeratus]TXD65445.1 aldo/keto reductase [Polaribacter glomeratus]